MEEKGKGQANYLREIILEGAQEKISVKLIRHITIIAISVSNANSTTDKCKIIPCFV